MSQKDIGNLESPLDGGSFINNELEPWRDALHSSHKGDDTPSYVTAGMIWVNDAGTPWIVNMYDGNNNVPLGTLDATTHKFTPANIPSEWGGSATGTANALTIAPDPAFTAYAAGMAFDVLITATNTAASPTFKVNALAVKTIKASLGAGKVGLPIGALQIGMIARFVYDGTDFLLLNVRANNQATDVASAATVNLNTALGDYIHITGTTDISTITLMQGLNRVVVFDGVLDLVDGANLILPTGADITTAAGDVMILRGEAAGVVRVVGYMRADGTSVGGGGDSFSSNLLHIQDLKADGVDGQSATNDVWNTHDLNTVVENNIAGSSLAADVVTLPANTYIAMSFGFAYKTGTSQYRIRNVDDNVTLGVSAQIHASTGAAVTATYPIFTKFTLAAEKDIELQTWVDSAGKLGDTFGGTGEDTPFADLMIWKV